MIPTFLALASAIACCQVMLVVKLADWLSPSSDAGRGTQESNRRARAAALA